MDLPIFEAIIDDDINSGLEVNFVSLVKRPAIQRNFLAFSESMRFKVSSEDRRIVSGALMLADTPIYRKHAKYGEFYIVFSKEQIYNAAKKFFALGYQNNLNLEHNGKKIVNGATMFESWITDKSRGISPMQGFEDTAEGSWFGSFYINNDDVWTDVKAGKFLGFSIEAYMDMQPVSLSQDEKIYHEIQSILAQIAD